MEEWIKHNISSFPQRTLPAHPHRLTTNSLREKNNYPLVPMMISIPNAVKRMKKAHNRPSDNVEFINKLQLPASLTISQDDRNYGQQLCMVFLYSDFGIGASSVSWLLIQTHTCMYSTKQPYNEFNHKKYIGVSTGP